ncbi:hypothetical protein EMIHUDRAFT_436909 [Emiliania huxleyi CCMP1516]|uniref:Uncharacterized protein n=2 Tax=Emiliania huxleyi TaxID=2903 RepID=A0A0D3ISZ6_EMIH1|nr:hypothetical protein EMIHUDRAFT_436909 [Emiliania huxleyi CCMP1516]EOD14381.1 hypothetical protein EMIHUDRAFT_436909 [Emiliania huxleyi CCMP1516]|eukprot:XP_005766810.1 hypothetical protein EMIHUDRAFT_436909 [Emiliania huxleyi CCMP1516]
MKSGTDEKCPAPCWRSTGAFDIWPEPRSKKRLFLPGGARAPPPHSLCSTRCEISYRNSFACTCSFVVSAHPIGALGCRATPVSGSIGSRLSLHDIQERTSPSNLPGGSERPRKRWLCFAVSQVRWL